MMGMTCRAQFAGFLPLCFSQTSVPLNLVPLASVPLVSVLPGSDGAVEAGLTGVLSLASIRRCFYFALSLMEKMGNAAYTR